MDGECGGSCGRSSALGTGRRGHRPQGLWAAARTLAFPLRPELWEGSTQRVMAHSSGCVGDALKGTRAESGRYDLMVAGTKKVTAGVTSLQILHAF